MNKSITVAVAALAASVTFAQVDPDRVVAIVNGEEIKGAEYYSTMEFLPNVGRQVGANQVEQGVPGFLTLELLINEYLEKQLAQKQGVYPTQEEIDAEYENQKKADPQFDAHLAAQGKTIDQKKHEIAVGLTEFKLQTIGITVTNQEVDDYYAKHPDEFTVPKQYKLRVIAVQTDAGKTAVDAALAANTPFADVAKQYSVEASKSIGGELGLVPETRLPPQVKSAIETAKIGSSSTWVSSPSGASYKFFIEDIQAPRKEVLDDSLRRGIREKMMLDRGRAKTDIAKEMKQARNEAKIEIKIVPFQQPWEQLMERLKG